MAEQALTQVQVSVILHAVNERRPLIPARYLAPAKVICLDAVRISQSLGDDQVGMRARAAAQLLLDLICPSVRADVRDELAVICERVATTSRVA